MKKRSLSTVIALSLGVVVMGALAISAFVSYLSLTRRYEEQSAELVRQNVEDVSTDMYDLTDALVFDRLDQIMNRYYYCLWEAYRVEKSLDELSQQDLDKFSEAISRGISVDEEFNIVDKNGIIVASSELENIGYDMHDGEQSAEFLVLLDGDQEELIQDVKERSYDGKRIKYAGKRLRTGAEFMQLGISELGYEMTLQTQADASVTNRRIGKEGYLLVCDDLGYIINSYHDEYTGKRLKEAGITLDYDQTYDYTAEKCDVFGIPSYININPANGVYVIGVYPVSEAAENVSVMMQATLALEILVFGVLFAVLIILLRRLFISNMLKVNHSLSEITKGELDEKVDVRDTIEFDALSNDINSTVDKLKGYIAEAEARIDADLALAKAIQTSAVPNVFPPFPDRKEFGLFASMVAAKEVGGDFYDFFLLPGDILAFLIADVSGKSIPGAMFMMRGKSVIKSLAEQGLSPAEVFTEANEKLCEGNDGELFITAWMGYLELKTGVVHVANAGHNPPVLIRDGKAEYVILRPNLMLAGMDGTRYIEHTLELKKGDMLYLYTDGVTEAMDREEEQYGEDRLIRLLSIGENYPEAADDNGMTAAVCEMVSADIREFTRGAEQSDDITMLCVKYTGD